MDSSSEKQLGQRLQRARQAAGLTQQALCQKAGLSYSTLAKIERGAIRTPSVFTIQSIAAALGTTLDELVGQAVAPALRQRQHTASGVSFVYFDVNGCLVRDFDRTFTKISEACDLPADVVETAFWHYNDQACRGDMTMAEFNAALGQHLQVPHLDWTAYYLAVAEPVSGMHDLARWVGQHYGIGLLTNIMPGLVSRMRERQLIPDIPYTAIIDSSVVHYLKPERAIYELAQARAGCSPEEILFVDDTKVNIMAAEKLGWHVMRFNDARREESIGRIREALEPVD